MLREQKYKKFSLSKVLWLHKSWGPLDFTFNDDGDVMIIILILAFVFNPQDLYY